LGLLVLFSLSAGCGVPPLITDDVHGSQRAALAGQILDADSHQQIANVGIYNAQTDQLLATTDSSGHYHIPSLLHQSYQFVARADRYEDKDFEVALQGTANHEDVSLFRLPCSAIGLTQDVGVEEDGGTSWVPGGLGAIADCFAQEFCGETGRCRSVYGAANLSATVLNYCTAKKLPEFFYKVDPDQESPGWDGGFRVTGRDVGSTAVISYVFEGGYDRYEGGVVELSKEENRLRIRMMPEAAHKEGGIDCRDNDAEPECADGAVWAGPEYGCIPTSQPQGPGGGGGGGGEDCEHSEGVTDPGGSAIRRICGGILTPPDPIAGGDVRRISP
jgi:hypothetical protein